MTIDFINMILLLTIIAGGLSIGFLIMNIVKLYKSNKGVYFQSPVSITKASNILNTQDSLNDECTTLLFPRTVNQEFSARLNFSKEGGESTNRVEFIVKNTTTLGRAQTADIFIKDIFVSQCHVTFIWEDGILSIRDENSTNGTFLNEVKLEPMVLTKIHPNTIVKIGKTAFSIDLLF